MSLAINNAFMTVQVRAEHNDRNHLVATFVNVGHLTTLLSNNNHQVIYGRRGTGKTHALAYAAEKFRDNGDAVIEVDMRTLGSTSGLYEDVGFSSSQRATRLLVDSLKAIHEGLRGFFLSNTDTYDFSKVGDVLNSLADAVTEVEVVGAYEDEVTNTKADESTRSAKSSVGWADKGITANLSDSDDSTKKLNEVVRVKKTGSVNPHIKFGSVVHELKQLISHLNGKVIAILIDEWTGVPMSLQPYLADFIRRAVLPVKGIVVKICSIEHRSNFRLMLSDTDYIGLELGADIAANVNLDDFMVFDTNSSRAQEFFKELLFKHIHELVGVGPLSPRDPTELISKAFTATSVFDDVVRAAEGVPRDAINIVGLAAQKASTAPIAAKHVNEAAERWYQQDKELAVRSNEPAQDLLNWIVDVVLVNRRARAFLLRSDTKNKLIDYLFDARLLHIVKRNISERDVPGARYNVLALDYGCYANLKGTSDWPGTFYTGDVETIGIDFVPKDDYRRIRRAILNLDDFNNKVIPRSMSRSPASKQKDVHTVSMDFDCGDD